MKAFRRQDKNFIKKLLFLFKDPGECCVLAQTKGNIKGSFRPKRIIARRGTFFNRKYFNESGTPAFRKI